MPVIREYESLIERSFVAHFNRIAMQRGEPEVWTVHYAGKCFRVTGITFSYITVDTHFRPDKQQPRATLEGYGLLRIESGRAILSRREY